MFVASIHDGWLTQFWLKYFQGQPDWIALALVPYLLFIVIYFTIGFGMLALEHFPSHKISEALRHRKCQKEVPMLTKKSVMKILGVIVPQLLVLYPGALFLGLPLLRLRLHVDVLGLPTALEFMSSIAVNLIVSEISFYYCHLLLHHRSLYGPIHSVHHQYPAPIALECVYWHWIETLVNFAVFIPGPLLLGSHAVTFWFWTFFTTVGICLHHSGYEIPWDSLPYVGSLSHYHDYHHKVSTKAYGFIGLMDWLHKTGFNEYRVYRGKWLKQQSRESE